MKESPPISARSLCGVPALLWAAGLVLLASAPAQAAKLVSAGVIDKDILVVNLSDGDVDHTEGSSGDVVNRYNPALSTSAAASASSWTLKSDQDSSYGAAGKHPTAAYRKTKMSGQAQGAWAGSDFSYEYTYEHWIYLKLPSSMVQGTSYTLEIASAVNSDKASVPIAFDIYKSVSEAVHVNLVGYAPDAPHKAADLYLWMGDGGGRDYSSFVGKAVYVYDVAAGQATQVGQVAAWKANGGGDVFNYALIRSGVWSADFSGFTKAGTYRLAIEGVGCSQDFTLASDAYASPFRVSLRGFAYMRMGQETPAGAKPPYRTPLYTPGKDPANTKVILTTMQQFDSGWSAFASASDPWDRPDDWARYAKPGSPTNANAWGGHSDAYDKDRHLGHVSIIWDMLLPYILTRGALSDDNTGIPESGNGVPDIIDEAAYEVDYWLRLRDGDGYGSGLTNPNGSNVLYQAGPSAISAWANAANAAMLGEAYRIAGKPDLMAKYRDAAASAYAYANGLANPLLDQKMDFGYTKLRGRDLKATAAAYLYNLTGERAYEDAVNASSNCTSAAATIDDGEQNQTWATAGYLLTPQPVHYATLQANMKASIIAEAKSREANYIQSRPSRRATDETPGYFHTSQNVQRSMIAHAVASSQADKDLFRKAMALEADWGLGRNPANMIQMGTAFTPLASKRSVEQMYTSGREDGLPGVDPGQTPYFNLDDWSCGMVMGCPSRLFANGYPVDFRNTWPVGEAYFNTPWVWAYSEFTPQQTMRGKTALYGYLVGLGGAAATQPLTVVKAGTGSGRVTSSPAGIDCGSTCIVSFPSGASVTLTAAADAGSTFAGWSGPCSGTGACTVALDSIQSVTATFTAEACTTSCPLTVTKSGAGAGRVTSSPAGIDCGSTCSAGYSNGTRVTLTAAADSGSTFAGWSGACSGTGVCTVSVDAAKSVQATFNPQSPSQLTLTVTRAGTGSGSVTSSPAGISCGATCSASFASATSVTLNAAAANGSTFVGWSGPCSGTGACTVTMDGAKAVTATFELNSATTRALLVSKAGTGSGTVTSSPVGIDCGSTCSAAFDSGASVTLSAAAASGSTFAGWSGACAGAGACSVTMTVARSVTATFVVAGADPLSATGSCGCGAASSIGSAGALWAALGWGFVGRRRRR